MSVFKEKSTWFFRGKIKLLDGSYKYYKKKCAARTKAQALECEREFRLSFQLQEKTANQLTFKELTELFLAEEKSKIKFTTFQEKERRIKTIYKNFGDYKIGLISKNIIQEALNELSTKLVESTVALYRSHLNQIFKFAVREGYLASNPVEGTFIKKDKSVQKEEMLFYEPHEFELLTNYFENDKARDFFIFLFYMGTRRGEALALNWNDIDFKNNSISISKTLHEHKRKGEGHVITSPKTQNSYRNITAPKVIMDMLQQKLANHKKFYDFSFDWFIFGGIKPLCVKFLAKQLKKAVENANKNGCNLKLIRIHDFRHSHASYLINNKTTDFNDYDIAKRLGDTIQTVQSTYAHIFKNSDNKIVSFIDKDTLKNTKNNNDQKLFSASTGDSEPPNLIQTLKDLKELVELGILSDEEFNQKKQEILKRI